MMTESCFSSKTLLVSKKLTKKKRRHLLKLIGLSVWPLALMALGLLFCRQKTGFQIDKICPPNYLMKVDAALHCGDCQEVKRILSQEFTYLGSGAQCYVFVSKDQEYVLKFFKMKRLTPKYWLNYIPLPWLDQYRFEKVDSREHRRQEIFNSYKIAFEQFKAHTGLLFVHLSKTKNLSLRADVQDKSGKKYSIALDSIPFILQKRAELLYGHVGKLIQEGKSEAALHAMRSILNLVQNRCSHGLADRNGAVGSNYGFIDGEAVHIDAGWMIRDDSLKEPLNTLREVFRVSKKIEFWLQNEYPDLVASFQEEVHDILDGYEVMSSF